MIWFKVFLSNIGCVDHLAGNCGASKFMGFEDILVVPVWEFPFTSPYKRVKSQIFVYFCQNASECPDIVSQLYLECCESISELIVMLQTLFRSASAQNRQMMAGK